MATLRQLRTRVASVKNIQKVTNAMQMVAAARMRRAQEGILAARPYAVQLDRVLQRLSKNVDEGGHPLLTERADGNIAIAVVTSDRGLCGGFNANICRTVVAELSNAGDREAKLVAVGRKGRDFFRNRGYQLIGEHLDLFKELVFGHAAVVAGDLTSRFLAGEVDKVLLAYSEFRSVANQVPIVRQLLPIAPQEDGDEEVRADYLFEPEPAALLDALVPRHVNFQVWRALLESNAGEQAARMQAMDSATKNAGDLIDELTKEMNRERQSAITLELMDIIGGAEAVS